LVPQYACVATSEAKAYPQNAISINECPAKFWITIRNEGIGPADILKISMKMEVFPYDRGMNDPIPEYDDSQMGPIVRPIIPANTERRLPDYNIPQWIDANITSEELKEIRARRKGIALHGKIYYRGGPDKSYWSQFFWWCLPDIDDRYWNITLANKPELNAHT
jgi:hypothetical protein